MQNRWNKLACSSKRLSVAYEAWFNELFALRKDRLQLPREGESVRDYTAECLAVKMCVRM